MWSVARGAVQMIWPARIGCRVVPGSRYADIPYDYFTFRKDTEQVQIVTNSL